MDELIIDPVVLENLANVVENYTAKQEEILSDYMQKMNTLSYYWDDDQTFGSLLNEVEVMVKSSKEIFLQMRMYYPRHFRNKAMEIRNRPKPKN